MPNPNSRPKTPAAYGQDLEADSRHRQKICLSNLNVQFCEGYRIKIFVLIRNSTWAKSLKIAVPVVQTLERSGRGVSVFSLITKRNVSSALLSFFPLFFSVHLPKFYRLNKTFFIFLAFFTIAIVTAHTDAGHCFRLIPRYQRVVLCLYSRQKSEGVNPTANINNL